MQNNATQKKCFKTSTKWAASLYYIFIFQECWNNTVLVLQEILKFAMQLAKSVKHL